MPDELEGAVMVEMRQVHGVARDQIVHSDDAVIERQQPVTQVRAEEAGGARYEEAHANRRPMLS